MAKDMAFVRAGARRNRDAPIRVPAGRWHQNETPALEVRPNEFDGWDVKHQGTADAISNHPDKATAIEAAQKIAEHEDGEVDVVVSEEDDETVSDEGRGVKFYFVVLLGLLVAITLIIVIVSRDRRRRPSSAPTTPTWARASS